MKIFIDKQRQLNYHPLVTYIILSPTEYKEYAESIEQLNDSHSLTRGIFKFRAIERGEKYSCDLSTELTSTIKRFNVILRLVDNNEGCYNYALSKLKFLPDSEIDEFSLREFITVVCKQNVKILKSQLDTAESNSENYTLISTLVQCFKDAINYKDVEHIGLPLGKSSPFGSPQGCFDNMSPLTDSDLCCHLPSSIAVYRDTVYGGLIGQEAKSAFKEIMKYLEMLMDAADMEESDKYAQGSVDDSKSEDFKADLYSRNKYGECPDIKINITRIMPNLRRRVRKAWGVEIIVGDTVTPIYFGSVTALMVYVGTLLKHKAGNRMTREAFKRSLPEPNSLTPRHEDVKWLHQLYRVMCAGAIKEFNEWYNDLKKDRYRAVSQGKSVANRIITTNMKQLFKALYYCKIHDIEVDKEKYYYIEIPPENIIVPKELKFLIEAN